MGAKFDGCFNVPKGDEKIYQSVLFGEIPSIEGGICDEKRSTNVIQFLQLLIFGFCRNILQNSACTTIFTYDIYDLLLLFADNFSRYTRHCAIIDNRKFVVCNVAEYLPGVRMMGKMWTSALLKEVNQKNNVLTPAGKLINYFISLTDYNKYITLNNGVQMNKLEYEIRIVWWFRTLRCFDLYRHTFNGRIWCHWSVILYKDVDHIYQQFVDFWTSAP